MRVLIMGSGGIGGYFGGMLALRGGHEVTFVARGAHLAAMRARGLEIRTGGETHLLQPVEVVDRPAEARGPFDYVLFAVKCYDTAAAAEALRPAVGPETAVVPFQNGVESVEQLSAVFGPERVLAGVARIETTILEPGVIDQRSPFKRIELAEPSGQITPRLERLAAALRQAGAEVTVADDAQRILWEKFIMLAANASITSVCQAPNGPIREVPEGLQLYRDLIREADAVARAGGVNLPPDTPDKALATVSGLPYQFGTSMQRDFERHNRVELEQLTGAVVRRGQALGVPTPAFGVVYAILKVRAASFGGLGQD
jgi:2-dehydropantoate 2-reductase